GEICDDANDAVSDFCSSTGPNACESSTLCPAGVTCDDGNPCTIDSCDPQHGCVVSGNVPDGTACTSPTGAGQCPSGGCVVPTVVEDGIAACGPNPDGTVACWGNSNRAIRSGLTSLPAGTYTAIGINDDENNSFVGLGCAINAQGYVYCWGNDRDGTMTNT